MKFEDFEVDGRDDMWTVPQVMNRSNKKPGGSGVSSVRGMGLVLKFCDNL